MLISIAFIIFLSFGFSICVLVLGSPVPGGARCAAGRPSPQSCPSRRVKAGHQGQGRMEVHRYYKWVDGSGGGVGQPPIDCCGGAGSGFGKRSFPCLSSSLFGDKMKTGTRMTGCAEAVCNSFVPLLRFELEVAHPKHKTATMSAGRTVRTLRSRKFFIAVAFPGENCLAGSGEFLQAWPKPSSSKTASIDTSHRCGC